MKPEIQDCQDNSHDRREDQQRDQHPKNDLQNFSQPNGSVWVSAMWASRGGPADGALAHVTHDQVRIVDSLLLPFGDWWQW